MRFLLSGPARPSRTSLLTPLPSPSFRQGATTFPSITEALTLDADVGEAQAEADKVAVLINAMAKRLEA